MIQLSFSRLYLVLVMFSFASLVPGTQASSREFPPDLNEGGEDIKNLIGGETRYTRVIWDPPQQTSFVFNISSGNSSLHFILIREKKVHCVRFVMRFIIKNDFSENSAIFVCVAEVLGSRLRQKCSLVNDTDDFNVNQGSFHGAPDECGSWYFTVFADNTSSYSNDSQLAVQVSEPYDSLVFRWLRVFTNLAFLPAIIIALKRRFYAEGIVYVLNFILSCVYHLCEAELHCFKGYDRLHYSDMYASDLSIIVTLWSMTGIKEPLKHYIYLTIAILLQFLVFKTSDSDQHLLVNVALGSLPASILIYQYISRSVKSRSCYPSRRRWALCLLPGFSLAVTGAFVIKLVTSSDDYYYAHSLWHLTIMLSVAFLLPHKEDFEGNQWYLTDHDRSTYTPLI